jgi:D-alanyl-D-alanine carboxypeptidase (penicillin-binding protein 5/6)
VGTERIWYGDKEQVKLGTDQDFWLALPKAEVPNIKAKYVLDKKELEAPIAAHQRVGEIQLYDRDKVVATGRWSRWKPLIKAACSRLSDYLHHTL